MQEEDPFVRERDIKEGFDFEEILNQPFISRRNEFTNDSAS
jgi:hypothetical protein